MWVVRGTLCDSLLVSLREWLLGLWLLLNLFLLQVCTLMSCSSGPHASLCGTWTHAAFVWDPLQRASDAAGGAVSPRRRPAAGAIPCNMGNKRQVHIGWATGRLFQNATNTSAAPCFGAPVLHDGTTNCYV